MRLFYGLAGEPAAPPTLKELAPRIGLRRGDAAQRLVRRAVAALLGPAAADPTGTALAVCGVCGRQIYRPATGAQHACSPECMAELRRRAGRRQHLREQAALEPLRRALQALPAGALHGLAERDRAILGRYYGLDDEPPQAQYEIARQLGLKPALVSNVVRRLTARLLGWQTVDPAGRHQVACTICGATTHLQRPKASTEHACSPECQSELLRRRAQTTMRQRRLAAIAPIRETLAALPMEAFRVLSQRDRAIVRRYYGLEDGTFPTQQELGQEFGLDQTAVSAIVRTAATRLGRPTGPASVHHGVTM